MASREVVPRKRGGKTVIEGGKIVGNLPSDKSTSPSSGPIVPASGIPSDEPSAVSSVSQAHSHFRKHVANLGPQPDGGERIRTEEVAVGDVIRCYGGGSSLSDFTVVGRSRATGNRWPVQVIDSSGARRTIYMSVGGSVLKLASGQDA